MAWRFPAYGTYARKQPFDWLCDAASFSFACWVRLTALGTSDQCAWSHRGTDGQASLRRTAAEGVWRLSVTIPGGTFVTKDSTAAAVAGTLYRACGSWIKNTSGGMRLWLNGTEQGSGASTTSQTVNYNPGVSSEMFLGHRSATANYLNGDLEGVLVVKNYLWTTADIAELTYTGLPWFFAWAGSAHSFYWLDSGILTRAPDQGNQSAHIESSGIYGTIGAGGDLGKYETVWIGSGGGGPQETASSGIVVDPDWTEFGTGVSVPETCETITGLTNGTTYQFKMRAEDAGGTYSADSLTVEATPNVYNIHVPRDIFLVSGSTLRTISTSAIPTSAVSALAASAEKQVRINFCGFEEGDPEYFSDQISGNVFGCWTPRVTGYRAAYITTTANTTSHYLTIGRPDNTWGSEDLSFNVAVTCVRMYVQFDETTLNAITAEAPFVRLHDAAGYGRFEICVRPDKKLAYYAGTGGSGTRTSLGTGATTLESGRWYELKWKAGRDTDTAYQAFVDGVEDISGTASFSSQDGGWLYLGRRNMVGWSSSQALTIYYDDVVIAGGGYPAASKIVVMLPYMSGNYTGWTPSTGTSKTLCIDDVPPNGDSDYIYSATVSDAYTCKLMSTEQAGVRGVIYAVKPKLMARKATSDSATEVKLRLRSGTTDTDTPLLSLSELVYDPIGMYFGTVPGGSQWTRDILDAVEVGCVKDSAGTGQVRVTHCALYVECSGGY